MGPTCKWPSHRRFHCQAAPNILPHAGAPPDHPHRGCRGIAMPSTPPASMSTLATTPHSPLKQPIAKHLCYGVINLNKLSNLLSHEVITWNKHLLHIEKTSHNGTLDPKVTGNLIVCVNRATRLVKSWLGASNECICVACFHAIVPDKTHVACA